MVLYCRDDGHLPHSYSNEHTPAPQEEPDQRVLGHNAGGEPRWPSAKCSSMAGCLSVQRPPGDKIDMKYKLNAFEHASGRTG